MGTETVNSGTTLTLTHSTYKLWEHSTPYLAQFRVRDSVYSSLRSLARYRNSRVRGTLWIEPQTGFPVYVACVHALFPIIQR